MVARSTRKQYCVGSTSNPHRVRIEFPTFYVPTIDQIYRYFDFRNKKEVSKYH